MAMRITVSKRELHTLLAALRTWQRATYEDQRHHDEIASNGGSVKPLSDREIDLLCEIDGMACCGLCDQSMLRRLAKPVVRTLWRAPRGALR